MIVRNIRPVDVIDNEELNVVTLEHLERRLGEECGAVRMEVRDARAEIRADIKDLRVEMVDRQVSMLKWLLGFFVAQTAALGALLAALR